MNIIGISAYHHDSAAAHLDKHLIKAASHEERFSRKKYDSNFPNKTIRWIRKQQEQVDVVAFYEKKDFIERQNIKRDIKKNLPGKFDIEFFDHHECHAMSSILTTNWDDCAVMVVDSIGGKYATSLGVYENNKITWLKRFEYPNSLGLFYSTITRFLGFTPLMDEEKVMSAAAYGDPKWAKYAKEKLIKTDIGEYTLLQDLRRGIGIGTLDWDIAASAQEILQECLLNLAGWLHMETGQFKLAYGGGVALNCVANTQLVRYTNFNEIAIQPAAGDAGCALGAAALVEKPLWEGPFLGFEDSLMQSPDEIAFRLLREEVVPVLNGRAEFGPRALGNRSLLADPRGNEIKDKVNEIKRRQKFRPFAPVILEEFANDIFEMPVSKTPYMQYTAKCKYPNKYPAICHVDNTSRVQTVSKNDNKGLYELLTKWYKETGCPMLLNTSLNIKGQPIVNDIKDAKQFEKHYNIKVLI